MQKHEKKDDSSGCRSEFWGICCESGKRYSQVVCKKFHISMAALDPTGNNSNTDTLTSPCVSLMVERDGCQYLLCSLKPDSILQVILNLYFDKGENITFFLKGHGTVHLSGYYICDESDAGFAESSRKGQINTLTKKGDKKPQTSFTVSADVETSDDEESSDVEEVEKAVVKEKAVSPVKKPFASPAKLISPKKDKSLKIISKKDSSEDDSSEDEDSEDEPANTADGKKLVTYATKRVHSTLESEEESSDDDDDSSDSATLTAELSKINKQLQSNKKFKAEASTPVQNNKMGQKTPIKLAVVVDLEDDAKTGKPDMNSSIGRTPMPKKCASSIVRQTLPIDSFLSKMKSQSKTPKKDSSDSDEMDTSTTKTPEKPTNQLNTSVQSESAKKKKKKKAKTAATENQVDSTNKSPSKPQFSHKLPSGVEFDDIRIGNGPIAKKGKLVHVYYTGKLENNKVFDSCQQGSKPFSFKLASGQVIKGWDLGIEGMKVGGKRRLKIPSNMGYAKQRMGDIPPNSTLYFVVELKAVS